MIVRHPPPGADSAPDHPGEPGRLVLYRDGLVSWDMALPYEGPSARLRLEVERHSLWHSRMSAANGTGEAVTLRGRSWSYDLRGRFVVERLREDDDGPRVGVELSAVDPLRWHPVRASA